MPSSTFTADAVLFDMDGTLTDSIAAVEAAWGRVANDLGLDPADVIAATHGKRAIDNLAYYRPEIKAHEMEAEVERFERSILEFADAFGKSQQQQMKAKKWRSASIASSSSTPSLAASNSSSTPASTPASSRRVSLSTPDDTNTEFNPSLSRPAFVARLSEILEDVLGEQNQTQTQDQKDVIEEDIEAAWEIEADGIDRSVRILPGVRAMLDSLPEGRFAVATSGAKTYAHGAMTRVGITPPPVTITADDKRLKAGKPAPDPFLLAAACLGFPASNCVVFEDSPSGIRAGVASGATVIAVCTSHERAKIEGCGAHFIVEDMRSVKVRTLSEGEGKTLEFTVDH